MSKHIFKVQVRSKDKKTKQLRREKIIPANVFGGGSESRSIQCREHDFVKLYNEVGDTGLLYLKEEEAKKDTPVLISEIQWDPITDQVLHVAFQQVNLKEKIQTEIPLEFVGEEEVDIPDTVLVHVRDTVEVEALPTDLPEKIVVNVAGLTEVGQSVTLADLEFDKEAVSLVVGEEGETAPVVILQEVKEEVIEEPEEPAEGEEGVEAAPAEGEGAKEEGKEEAKPEGDQAEAKKEEKTE